MYRHDVPPKIEVYRRSSNNQKIKLIVVHPSMDDFLEFEPFNSNFDDYSSTFDERYVRYHTWIDYPEYCAVVYDSNGVHYSRDRLLGLKRKHNRISRYRKRHYRKRAYAHYRQISTFQERKWANAFDDEEDCPPVRSRRTVKLLPDCWDEPRTHNDKSWKTQSKRSHQWKPLDK